MWRASLVLLVLAIAEFSSADVQYGKDIQPLNRLKRSPHYYNDDCPPPHHRHGPPFWPPPPPYWRPPPPPPPPPPYWPPPPPPQEQNQNAAYIDNSKPVDSNCCGNSGSAGSNAVSNAQSDTGEAIAVAIARAKTN